MADSPTISHETIYCAIYAMPRGGLRTELVKMLRHSHAGRLPRARGSARFTGIQGMTPIALRPPEVAARIVPGHWEADLIKGARNASAVGTMVERTSRFLMLARMDNASAASALAGFSRRLRTVPPSLRKTLTYDQGTEMALHHDLAKRLRLDIYFCDPHSPWQRGTNENANGLIREYLPKRLNLNAFSDPDLRRIEDALNNRPRKILGFRTPAEVFADLKLSDIAGVALQVWNRPGAPSDRTLRSHPPWARNSRMLGFVQQGCVMALAGSIAGRAIGRDGAASAVPWRAPARPAAGS
jgi:IS30 family transposase